MQQLWESLGGNTGKSVLARRFSDVVPLKRCVKGQIELARERLKGHLTTFTINNVVRELGA